MARSLKAEWFFVLGYLFAKRHRYIAALEQFERVLALHPNDAHVLCLAGWCCNALAQHDRAFTLFDRALQASPAYAYARAGLGKSLIYSQRWQDGIDAIDRAIRIDPAYGKKADYLRLLGIALFNTGQNKRAYEVLLEASVKDPTDNQIREVLEKIEQTSE